MNFGKTLAEQIPISDHSFRYFHCHCLFIVIVIEVTSEYEKFSCRHEILATSASLSFCLPNLTYITVLSIHCINCFVSDVTTHPCSTITVVVLCLQFILKLILVYVIQFSITSYLTYFVTDSIYLKIIISVLVQTAINCKQQFRNHLWPLLLTWFNFTHSMDK